MLGKVLDFRTACWKTFSGNNFKRSSVYQKRTVTVSYTSCRNSNKSSTDDPDAPLPFSKSKAATWSAQNSFSGRGGRTDDTPWYQPFVISASIGAILIWFCILREENDVDKEFGKSLFERIDGLEIKQLELALEHSRPGEDTSAIRKRLNELKHVD